MGRAAGPLLLLAALAAPADPARAAGAPLQARCEAALPPTTATVTAPAPTVTIDNSLSYLALTRMQGRTRARAWVLGLTRTDSHVAINTSGIVLADPAGTTECLAPRVRVALWYTPITVYVGSEFGPGTCAYDAIVAHEMRHVRAYADHLPAVEQDVRAALARRFGTGPLYAPRGQANALLAREINARWLPYIKSELGAVERRQATIDSAAEYARLSKVCQGEVQSILHATRRTR